MDVSKLEQTLREKEWCCEHRDSRAFTYSKTFQSGTTTIDFYNSTIGIDASSGISFHTRLSLCRLTNDSLKAKTPDGVSVSVKL